jgi:plasmid stability protein
VPGLVIKNLPPELHRKLKERAARHHRSMNKEVLHMLERSLDEGDRRENAPPPLSGRLPLTDEILDKAKSRWPE